MSQGLQQKKHTQYFKQCLPKTVIVGGREKAAVESGTTKLFPKLCFGVYGTVTFFWRYIIVCHIYLFIYLI